MGVAKRALRITALAVGLLLPMGAWADGLPDPGSPAEDAAPAVLLAQAPRYATVTAGSANVYKAPNESSPVVTKVRRGSYLEVGGIRGNWVKVRTDAGLVGFVTKTNVVPGKKSLDGPPPDGGGSRGGGGGGGGGMGRGIGSGVTVEGRTGLLAKAGLQFAGNSYGFKADGGFSRSVGMQTAYAGVVTDVEYWLIEMAGAHFRFSSAFGSMTAELSPPVNKRVDRIPTNINQIQLDILGRYFFGDDPAAASVNGKVGYHMHQMLIDPIVQGDRPLFLVSQNYSGVVVGLGGDVPLGSPSLGLKVGLDYWVTAALTEGESNASGKSKGATGLGVTAGTYYNFSDTAGMEVGVEYHSFTGAFSGTGDRFNSTVTNAKTTDTYILLGLSGTFRF